MRASTCKGCGAAIVWIRTPGGKSMPCDATPRYYIEKPRSGSKKIVTPNGEVISCEYTEDPHKATAPASLPTGGAAGRQAASSRGRNTMDKLTWYDDDGGFTAAVGTRLHWRGLPLRSNRVDAGRNRKDGDDVRG